MLLKEGWLPDRMLNKVSKYEVTKSVSIRLPDRMLNKVSYVSLSVVLPTNSLIPTYLPTNSRTYLPTYSLTNTDRNHPQPASRAVGAKRLAA